MFAPVPGSSPSAPKDPKESRRWLKRRVPGRELHRLAPRRPRPRRFGSGRSGVAWDRVRHIVRAWWLWLAAALLAQYAGLWYLALPLTFMSVLLYHADSSKHPAIYALEPDFDTASPEFEVTMAGITGMPLVDGNRVDIYQNGDEFYPAMLEAIEAAQHSVTMEQYIFWDGLIGRRFAELLADKAGEGIEVKLLVDAVGSSSLGEPILSILEAGGCQLAWFRPIHWYTLDRANHRTHRKSLIVDGCVAFTGGAGLGDHWLGSAASPAEWRDTQVRVTGPAVLALQTGFAQNWLSTTGEIVSGSGFFPLAVPLGDKPAGAVQVQSILSSPSTGGTAAATMYLIAVQCARRHLHIANPYFIPDVRVIEMLADACRRGVTVRLMVAGQHNDTWWARQNSLRLYGRLLEAGVEIYEFQPTMLHQKTMVVDGVWATVGTTNFDNRSFALSEETNICFHDKALVADLNRVFEEDLAHCSRVDLAAWRSRGIRQKTREWLASLIEDQV